MFNLQTSSQLSFSQKYQFWFFLLISIIILNLPLVSVPFKWLESYFHEISHGIAALITGGSIIQIQLFPNGAGLCTTRGGANFLISFMGYAGAVFWGMLIYSIASVHLRTAQAFSGILIALFISTLIFWVRDILSFVIISVLLLFFVMQFKLPKSQYLQKILQLTGIMVLMNSLLSPLYLIDGRSIGDGEALDKLTMMPEFFWVIIWSTLGVSALYILSKKNFR